jgi:hypothetical protein
MLAVIAPMTKDEFKKLWAKRYPEAVPISYTFRHESNYQLEFALKTVGGEFDRLSGRKYALHKNLDFTGAKDNQS